MKYVSIQGHTISEAELSPRVPTYVSVKLLIDFIQLAINETIITEIEDMIRGRGTLVGNRSNHPMYSISTDWGIKQEIKQCHILDIPDS